MAKKKKRKKKRSDKKIMALAVLAAAFIVVLLGLVPVEHLEGLPYLLDDPHGIFGSGEGGLLTGLLPEEGEEPAGWVSPDGNEPEDSLAASSGNLTGVPEGETAPVGGDEPASDATADGEANPGDSAEESAAGEYSDAQTTDESSVDGGSANPDGGASPGSSNGSLVFDEDARIITDCPVVRVVDGDTMIITINGVDERVRLIGVDTPESVHPTADKNVPYGEVASAFAKEYLTDKTVTVELDVQDRDRYNRILAYIYVDGKMFNEVLMEEGHAQIATYPPNVKYVERFQALQDQAQEAKVGMWADDLEDLLWY